jgi:hypothetical protein
MSNLSDLTPGTWTVDASHSTVGFVARHKVKIELEIQAAKA